MDPAVLSTAAGLIGSMIGGAATFSASWVTQYRQLRTQTLAEQAAKREVVYSEFILEAAKRIAESWSRQAESPEVLALLYSAIQRMRLISSPDVMTAAEAVIKSVVDAYAAPNRTFEDLRQSLQDDGQFHDPLQDFIEACRTELALLRR